MNSPSYEILLLCVMKSLNVLNKQSKIDAKLLVIKLTYNFRFPNYPKCPALAKRRGQMESRM